jgi:non-ribosomal peptide synthetase component F
VVTTHALADIIAFIGVLYSGNFYVPIDGGLTDEAIEARFKVIPPAMVIRGDDVSTLADTTPDLKLLNDIRAKQLDVDPAYAVFTSGSTGVPKCAVSSHRAAIDLTEWHSTTFNYSEQTIFGNQTPFYFIAAVKEIYLTLRNSCTTHILPKVLFASPLSLLQRLDELNVNTVMWATAAVKLIANSGALGKFVPTQLTHVFFSGENIQAKQLNVWRKALPNAVYVNLYGLTETTTNLSYYVVNRELSDDENVPIGNARRNVGILLLDGDVLANVGAGGIGEIVVRGSAVSLGYFGNADSTAAAFVQNPLNDKYRDIVYRTGDIARINDFGELVYVSRADNQVKHKGVRIELGEVETTAAAIPGVALVCCLYDHDKSKIVLFYEGDTSETEVRRILSLKLPKYMLPGSVVQLDKMPETPNGKIDRVLLKSNLNSK